MATMFLDTACAFERQYNEPDGFKSWEAVEGILEDGFTFEKDCIRFERQSVEAFQLVDDDDECPLAQNTSHYDACCTPKKVSGEFVFEQDYIPFIRQRVEAFPLDSEYCFMFEEGCIPFIRQRVEAAQPIDDYESDLNSIMCDFGDFGKVKMPFLPASSDSTASTCDSYSSESSVDY
jgi:hypothetical protein